MRKDKDVAFNLRKQGKTYRQIESELKVSRSTLSEWFRNVEWSKHLSKNHTQSNIKLSTERIRKLNEGRKKSLDILYRKNEIEAVIEYEIFKKQPLFMAGLMVYAGEGDKRNPNQTRMSNTDFYLHEILIRFSEEFLKIKRGSIKINLIVYPDKNIEECINIWSETLRIPKGNFYKTQVIKGKEAVKRLQYGIGISIISCTTTTKKKVLKWMELCRKDFLV